MTDVKGMFSTVPIIWCRIDKVHLFCYLAAPIRQELV